MNTQTRQSLKNKMSSDMVDSGCVPFGMIRVSVVTQDRSLG